MSLWTAAPYGVYGVGAAPCSTGPAALLAR